MKHVAEVLIVLAAVTLMCCADSIVDVVIKAVGL